MAQAEQWERAIGFALEDEFGVAEDAPTWWVASIGGQLKTEPGVVEETPRFGTIDRTGTRVHGSKVTGTLELEIGPGVEDLLEALASLRDGSTRYYNSFTVWENWDPELETAFISTGVCANQITLKCDVGGDLVASVACLGRERAAGSWQSMAAVSLPAQPYTFEELLITLSAGETTARGANLVIEHNLRDDRYGADRTRLLQHLPSQGRKITLTVPRDMIDATYHTALSSQVPFEGTLAWERGADTLTVTLAALKVLNPDPEQENQPIEMLAVAPAIGEAAVEWGYGGY